MASLNQQMRVAGYVPLTDHGFALPLYEVATTVGRSNAPYVAIPEIQGDREAPIAGFDILNIEGMGVTWLPTSAVEVRVGDAWQDVFLWNDRVFMGTAEKIFDAVTPLHDELKRDVPLTFLDLALGARSHTTSDAAQSALDFLCELLGETAGAESFRDTVIAPGVLLELHRQIYRKSPGGALPDALRDFSIEPSGAGRFAVKLPHGSSSLLGTPEEFALLIEAIAAFGLKIGASLEAFELEDPELVEPETRPPLETPPDAADDQPAAPSGLASFWSGGDREIAIDVGTTNTRVFVRGRGVVLVEPSVVAIETVSGVKWARAVGEEAIQLAQKRPDEVELIRPMREGAITDIDVAEQMIKHFFKAVRGKRLFQRRPDVIISVPLGATQVERRAIRDAVVNVGANKVWLIEEPVAAAIGAGLPVSQPIGSMVVDIGSGRTEVAVISVSGIAYATALRVGGDWMDDAIVSYVRRNHNVLIGPATAARIKNQVGCAWAPRDADGKSTDGVTVLIKGRDLTSGAPTEITINQRQISEALREPVGTIVEAVRIALENLAPELAADIIDQGIVLTGGGALLQGLDEVLRAETGLPVVVAEDPMNCVAKGIGRVLDDPELRGVLMPA